MKNIQEKFESLMEDFFIHRVAYDARNREVAIGDFVEVIKEMRKEDIFWVSFYELESVDMGKIGADYADIRATIFDSEIQDQGDVFFSHYMNEIKYFVETVKSL